MEENGLKNGRINAKLMLGGNERMTKEGGGIGKGRKTENR